jgi:hypothetical protein
MTRLAVFVITALASLGALAALGLVTPATAASHKILVLPTDGNADAATRSKLTTQVVKLAKGLEGQVSTAGATFADTALAVGCDPQAAGCSDQVLATLGVDELVWATATKDGGQTRVVVRRATKGSPPREISTTIAPSDSTDRIDAGMAPLFGAPGARPEPAASPSVPPPDVAVAPLASGSPAGPQAPSPELPEANRERTMGIAFATGGGVAVVLGLALWGSYSSLQDKIDTHVTNNRADFDDLKALENKAATYAIAGDCLVLAGLAAGGLGAYYLYWRPKHRIAVTPVPIAGGAGVTLTILGGL